MTGKRPMLRAGAFAMALVQTGLALGEDERVDRPSPSLAAVPVDRGIVSAPGRFVVEPSFSYAHSDSTVVAVEGYTVIPALVVGLINVSQVQRDIFTTAVTLKYGWSSRLETSLRIPWLSIQEDVREREAFEGTPVDNVRGSSGEGLGDVEAQLRYQLNDGTGGWPYLITSLRIKSNTGEGPYDVGRRELRDSEGDVIGEELTERPTGSGFWAVEPGLSVIYTSDPAVLFGNLGYAWHFEEDVGADNGGTVDPGNIVRFGFGMGFAVNQKTSFSVAYDHAVIQDTEVENDSDLLTPQFDRLQVGSLAFAVSHRLNHRSRVNLGVSVGVTEQAPSTELTLKVPLTFN